ncbi:MAG: DUF3810 domain-containing protein [Oscillospiraceae bacterium]|nr:DUF3810 domain-containing protein [Oscillospiraceae bacterium]
MKVVGRLIVSAVLVIVTGLLMSVARFAPKMLFGFYTNVSGQALSAVSSVTGAMPFALWEWLAVVIVLLALYFLFRKFRPIAWLTGLITFLAAGALVFTVLWGLNYYAPPVEESFGLSKEPYSVQTLKETTLYLARQADAAAGQVQRDAEGTMLSSFDRWASMAGDGFTALAQKDARFGGETPKVKKLLSGRLFSYMGYTGIFVPFTAEANVNPEASTPSLPFTMCHELAHSKTIAREDEANFCAFLACLENEDPAFQYSAWYSAFSYAYASLRRADPAAAQEVANSLSDLVRADYRAANEHYAQFDGPVQETAQKVNDLYLKTAGDESGTESYGEVTDLLVAWYLQENYG